MTKLLLVDSDDVFHTRLSDLAVSASLVVARVDTTGADADEAAKRVLDDDPDVVMVDVARGEETALEIVAALDLDRPSLTCILVAKPDATMWQRALRAGARDLVSPTAADDELLESLERALARSSHVPAAAGHVPAHAEDPPGGRVLSIVSPKGGCGKTMLATNLAYGLHAAGRGQVVIVDFDLQFGDVAGALGLRPEYTISNAIGAAGDSTATKSFLATHVSGLFALCAPNNPAEADAIEPKMLEELVDTLRAEFDWVIVDTSAGVSEANLTAIESSTDVLMVATTDLAAIQAMRKAVVVLDQIGLTSHRRWYVLNRANARVGLDQTDIERSVGLQIDGTIPSARAVPVAMNQGVPVLEDDPKSPAARAMRDFLARVAPHDAGKASGGDSKSWLQRIRT